MSSPTMPMSRTSSVFCSSCRGLLPPNNILHHRRAGVLNNAIICTMEGQQGVDVRSSPLGGKGLFAKRAFDAGEVVLELERPLVGVLDKERRSDTCAWCFMWTSLPLYEIDSDAAKKVNFCTSCKKVAYCSKRCQSKHWKAGHKRECKRLATIPPTHPNVPIAMAQIVRGSDAGDEACKSVFDMESHKGDFFHERGEKIEAMEKMAEATLMLLGEDDNRLPMMLLLVCIIMSNSATLVTPTFDPIGLFLDPMGSKANHSCVPNAIMMFDGPKLQLRTLERLAANQEVLISYIENNNPYGVRQAELKDRFHFECKCAKCQLGAEAPQDRFLPTSPELNQVMAGMPETFVTQATEGFVNREHQLGTTPELRFLASLQAFGFQCLDENHHLGDLMNPKTGIDLCLRSGAWPITRAPLPALYQIRVPQSLFERNVDAAFLAALKTYCFIDPVLYPQPFHPVRLVHAWTLAELAGSLDTATGSQSPVVAYTAARGIRLTTIRLRVLIEAVDAVPKSHGSGSVFARAVGNVWQGIVAAASHPDQNWMRLIRREAESGWEKIIALAQDPALQSLVDKE